MLKLNKEIEKDALENFDMLNAMSKVMILLPLRQQMILKIINTYFQKKTHRKWTRKT